MKWVLKSHASSLRSDIEAFQAKHNIAPKAVAGLHHDGLRYVLWYWTLG